MSKNETLERLSLVLFGAAIGVLIGQVTVLRPLTPYDGFVIVIALLLCVFVLRGQV